ncbi:MAG: hypothetical protein A2293_07685 [Elusimicrobia bacterium RIFOXYB2_FULL_49_7]|nr:MAG: hypothetical protein A2293_07685 [Elusimicrobia bacterium RIFOXYB2_FULL_49_7]
MADIAFLLLIFLMVTSMSSPAKSKQLQLPLVQRAEKVKMKKSQDIFIAKDGSYYYDNKQASLDLLEERFSGLSEASRNAIVFIHGDEDTPYRFIDGVLRMLQDCRIQRCVFVTKKRDNGNPPRESL